jgi:hypothetical protein
MRIKEKRGVDYTEEEVRTLANVKLEKFLNPRAVRSEMVEHYRRQRPPLPLPSTPPAPENYGFEDSTIYDSHRGPLQWIRKLLNPILKLFFNPNPIIQVLHRQGKLNDYVLQRFDVVSQRFVTRDELDTLNFEVLNNIVLEITRLGIEVKNLSMRIESMNARQEFNERRARAFEGLVASPGGAAAQVTRPEGGAPETEEGEPRSRRRRRRRGRRRPEGEPAAAAHQAPAGESGPPDANRSEPGPEAHSAPATSPPPSDSGTDQ